MYRKTLLVLLEENNYVLLAWVKEKSSRRYNECRRRSRRTPAANETPGNAQKKCQNNYDLVGEVSKERHRLQAEYDCKLQCLNTRFS